MFELNSGVLAENLIFHDHIFELQRGCQLAKSLRRHNAKFFFSRRVDINETA
jgi:hypothetical protein